LKKLKISGSPLSLKIWTVSCMSNTSSYSMKLFMQWKEIVSNFTLWEETFRNFWRVQYEHSCYLFEIASAFLQFVAEKLSQHVGWLKCRHCMVPPRSWGQVPEEDSAEPANHGLGILLPTKIIQYFTFRDLDNYGCAVL
jgi:hypothetical protein